MTAAAGIMILCDYSGAEKVLLLRRGNGGDHPGEWCFPGGRMKPGETAEQAAVRETLEEIGRQQYDEPMLWTRQIREGIDYTTFIARSTREFTPKLSDEHTAWMWCSVDALVAKPLKPPDPMAEMR